MGETREREAAEMAASNVQVLHAFGDTLTFSEEEWLGLTSWQKELYRTVMRDTAELFHSLGFMYQVKEEQELRNSWAPRSTEESVWPPESIIIEEISGKNFIIQISEVPVTPEDRALPSFPSLTDSTWIQSSRAKTDNPSEAVTFLTPESPGAGLVGLDLGAYPSMAGPGSSLMSLNTEPSAATRSQDSAAFIPSVTIKTEDTPELPSYVAADPCHPTDVPITGSDLQTLSTAVLSETDFLTVIQVKDINVGPVGELGPVQTELWDVHTGSTNLLWSSKAEAPQDPQAVFPVALMVSHNTSNGTAGHGPVIVGPAQWCQQIPVAGCQQVDGPSQWTAPGHPGSLPESPEQLKCEASVSTKRYALRSREARPNAAHRDPALEEPLQPSKLFSCVECGRTFSYLFQFNRHQKIHARDKLLLRPVAPPPKKVYKLPQFLPAHSRGEDTKVEATGDSCQKLHQHLQLSTVFLQNLLTSTCGFQYD